MTALPAIRRWASSNGVSVAWGAIPGPSWSAKSRKSEMRVHKLELFFLKYILTSVIIGGVGSYGRSEMQIQEHDLVVPARSGANRLGDVHTWGGFNSLRSGPTNGQ